MSDVKMNTTVAVVAFVAAISTSTSVLSAPTADAHLSADARAGVLVSKMTQDEKFSWISGPMAIAWNGTPKPDGAIGSAAYYPAIPRLGIPAMQQADASMGVSNLGETRPGDNATAMPSTLLLGATFDPLIAFQAGQVVGSEARAKGFNVQLAGGANLIREPRAGRNFEYVSEDPLLTAVIAGNSISGIQSNNVVSTIKHFAVNSQETGRVLANSVLNESAMRESDLLAFQMAIEIGKPGAVMSGYNLVNGDYASENSFLTKDVLKRDWKYPGWVMSDWGATHSTEKAILAGTDVQSGANIDTQPFFGGPLRIAVESGKVPQARIDDAVRRQLRSLISVGAFDHPAIPGQPIDYMQNRLTAQRVAEAGIVLLRNEGGFLPLAKGAKKILVVGHYADLGVLAGGGSSGVTPVGSILSEGIQLADLALPKVHQPSVPLMAVKAESGAAVVEYSSGKDMAQTLAAARDASAVIIYAEEWRSEGLDGKGLILPDNQDALITAVASANPNTIVVLETGGAVLMPWLESVRSVLSVFYPGSGGAEAIAGVIFGRVEPSGRLPVTFPASEAQLPIQAQRDPDSTTSLPGQPLKGGVFDVSYDKEGSDVGYRWHERENLKPLFPFGYGLSYTSFEYKDFSVHRVNGVLTATVVVKNTGKRRGSDVPQLYVELEGKGGFVRRLAAFEKVALDVGQSKAVTLKVDPRLLARFDSKNQRWVIAADNYTVHLATSASSLVATAKLMVPGQTMAP